MERDWDSSVPRVEDGVAHTAVGEIDRKVVDRAEPAPGKLLTSMPTSSLRRIGNEMTRSVVAAYAAGA
jgi:hypothetical protein